MYCGCRLSINVYENRYCLTRLLFLRATPICKFCQVIAIRIQRKIVSDVISVLRRIGFHSIKVYNEAGLLLDEWKASQE